jgi:hypothetical protein
MPKHPREEEAHDEGFARFLAQSDGGHMKIYMENPKTATVLYRDPFSAMVWWSFQEYQNTEHHREELMKTVERAGKILNDLKLKLTEAEARPAGNKKPAEIPSCCKGHPLVAFDGDYDCCNLCSKDMNEVTLAKQCKSCSVSVCTACMECCDDVGLHLFMSHNTNVYVTYRFNIIRQQRGIAMRNHEENMKGINQLRAEFYDTEEHRDNLREQIKVAEDHLRDAQTKLDDAERRAAVV